MASFPCRYHGISGNRAPREEKTLPGILEKTISRDQLIAHPLDPGRKHRKNLLKLRAAPLLKILLSKKTKMQPKVKETLGILVLLGQD